MSDTFCSICCIDYYSVYLLVYMSFVTLCDASPHIINPSTCCIDLSSISREFSRNWQSSFISDGVEGKDNSGALSCDGKRFGLLHKKLLFSAISFLRKL